jgi:hypothetical protein
MGLTKSDIIVIKIFKKEIINECNINQIQGEIKMANQQIDTNQLSQAKANINISVGLLTQAIEKSASDQKMAQEAVKQAAYELSQAQSSIIQSQNATSSNSNIDIITE